MPKSLKASSIKCLIALLTSLSSRKHYFVPSTEQRLVKLNVYKGNASRTTCSIYIKLMSFIKSLCFGFTVSRGVLVPRACGRPVRAERLSV